MAGEAFSEYKFSDLDLNKDILRGLDNLGFEQMTPIQAEAIPVLMTGQDVIGQAQTGTGKTAAFGLPLLNMVEPDNKKLQAIILCPTRELAMQVASEIRSFTTYMHNVKILPVYGGQDIRRQIQGLKGVQIVVGTPGRVMDHMNRHTIKMDNVKFCILDEADEMLKMGFREDMETILGQIDHPHQTCLFSATMPKEILDIAHKFQNNAKHIKIASKELTIERIKQYYYPVKWEYKTQALLRLMAFYRYDKAIVFCNTKSMTDNLCKELIEEGYSAAALHGDLNQHQRDNVMNGFRKGTINVLIATDIAARGIDVDDVEAVFNYDIPQETEFYVHRIGRTGRAGREGVSHTLCKSKEFQRIHDIEKVCHAKMEEARIPSSAAINSARENKALDKAMRELSKGQCGKYIPVLKDYCQKNQIQVEELAAAFLKLELGELLEELEISLPDRKSIRRGRRGDRDRNRREDSSRRQKDRSRGKSGDRRENGGGRRDDDRNRRNAGRHDRNSADPRRRADERNKKSRNSGPQEGWDFNRNLTREERKKIKKKNKEISKRVLKKAYKEM